VTNTSTWISVLRAVQATGRLRMLVLNAAQLAVGAVLDLEESALRRVLEVNVFGAFYALRACLPPMIESGGGSIVAIASTDAIFAEQQLSAYCASKGALLQLTRSVAVDYARKGVRANALCPGPIDTPFFRRHVAAAPDPESFLRAKVARHPAGRLLTPTDVAHAVCFLLSEQAEGFNGAALTIDGGLTTTFAFEE
jgi:NAD(P)-dependent dehydrogenase (short-subunit alcohol dehydrogenase family)